MISEAEIQITNDPADIHACALMMADTDPWITLGMDYEGCLAAFRGECKEIYVLKDNSSIAGFVILQVCGTFSGYIQTLCINEKYRGNGLGTRFLSFCEERVLKFSPNLFICVSSFNLGAKRLYLRYGFKVVGELENFIKYGFDEILMRKTAGPRAGYKPVN